MNHLKTVNSHIKQHYKKYLFGIFGAFAVVKTILLFSGFFGLIQMVRTLAAGEIGPVATNVVITGSTTIGQTLTGNYTYTNEFWDNVGSPRFSSREAGYIGFAIDTGGNKYVSYNEPTNSNKANVMKYNSGTDAWEDLGVRISDGGVYYTSLATYQGRPYLAYRDEFRAGKATVMKFTPEFTDFGGNPIRSSIGTKGFSDGQVDYLSFTMDSGGIQYVAYQDSTISNKITVMKFDFGKTNIWKVVGTKGFSADIVYRTSIAVDNEGTPYVSYRDGEASTKNRVTVMKYNSSHDTWDVVGTTGFSDGQADYTSLAIDAAGTPYVAYRDAENGYKGTVMKYNSGTNSWDVVGVKGFSTEQVAYTSLAIDNGVPYVGYRNGASPYGATVVKFNGSAWEIVGGIKGFSDGIAETPVLSTYNGTPYIAYSDGASQKMTVMKFDTIFEGTSTYKWYRNDVEITGATARTYMTTSGDGGKTIKFEVTPISQSPKTGTPVLSSGVLIPADTDSDGIYDTTDNCLIVPNPGQEDSNAITGGVLTFTKANYANWNLPANQDCITANVCITRKNSKGIYNAVTESGYDDSGWTSPADTERAPGECVDKDTLTFEERNNAVWHIPVSNTWEMVGHNMCLHLITDDKYYDVVFNSWTQGSGGVPTGGGFSYTRTAYPRIINTGNACDCLDSICTTGNDIYNNLICAPVDPACNVGSGGGSGGGSGSGGGGGGDNIIKDDCKLPSVLACANDEGRDISSSYYDRTCCGGVPGTGTHNAATVGCTAYSDELNSAYIFAFENGITTIKDCSSVDLNNKLIRSHLAKMISQFAVKVLGMKPDTTKPCIFADMKDRSKEMQFYSKLACQLGLMGLDTDGITQKTNFDPKDIVDRAQFGTVLSRLLRGTEYAGGKPFYVKHLNAIKKENIINNIVQPLTPELRGRVMLMLQRITEKK